ncbi:MAG: radical SAM protein, partial [Candidatus Methylomirabilis sp.]|nr:radical SAM protein [Deltaproteobacteria bacterium]
FLGGHLVGRAIEDRLARRESARETLRRLVLGGAFLEATVQSFGTNSMIRSADGFFPHVFMPDFHGPHFEEALRRVALPGRGPNILYFSVTGECPSACEYCFAGAGGGVKEDIGDEAVLDVARKVAALRVPLVNLSGGEPMTRFGRILDATRILSEGCEVRMFTGGFGLTLGRLAELRDAGLRGVFVSLDTEDEATFDARRRKEGAFRAATEALRLCARQGMPTFINCVVGPGRFRDREEIARFLRFVEGLHPAIVVNFLPQLHTGRGAETESFRKPEDCHGVARRIVRTAAEMGRPVSMLFGRVDRELGCPGAGGKLMNVDIRGNVTVCISRASLGNLLEEPFDRIYDRFVRRCNRLKVGFFCCDVSERESDELLDPEDSRAALNAFFSRAPDSEVQKAVDRLGWALDLAFR